MRTVLIALSLGLTLSTAAFAKSKGPSCGQIEAAISATEDFSEVALAGENSEAQRAFGKIATSLEAVSAAMPEGDAAAAKARHQETGQAMQGGNLAAAAVQATEIYRILASAFQKRLPAPLEVAMLDYAGFRLHGLLAMEPLDWAAISATAGEAAANWRRVGEGLSDRALRDLGDTVHQSLAASVSAKQAAWLHFAAQAELDTVDLLERQVKNRGAEACK